MEFKEPRKQKEKQGAKRLKAWLEARGWGVWKLHGGLYQSGWPDFYCSHPIKGSIFIETKVIGAKLRESQIKLFLQLEKKGTKIYVLTDEKSTSCLDRPPNWSYFI